MLPADRNLNRFLSSTTSKEPGSLECAPPPDSSSVLLSPLSGPLLWLSGEGESERFEFGTEIGGESGGGEAGRRGRLVSLSSCGAAIADGSPS